MKTEQETSVPTVELLDRLGRVLGGEPSEGSRDEDRQDTSEVPMRRASVAMVLRPSASAGASAPWDGIELALIERARRPGDPWSGQVAMPGGRADPGDRDLVDTAIRETAEEVGLVLERSACLGSLGAHRAHTRVPAMAISGFVFGVAPDARLGAVEPQEVASASWVPLTHLLDPAAAVRYRFVSSMDPFPGVLLPDGRNVLWGLTYRFVDTMLRHLDERLPTPSSTGPVLVHDPDRSPSG